MVFVARWDGVSRAKDGVIVVVVRREVEEESGRKEKRMKPAGWESRWLRGWNCSLMELRIWGGLGGGGLAWFVRLGQLQVSIQINKQAGQQVPRCTYSGVVEGRPVDKGVGLGMV